MWRRVGRSEGGSFEGNGPWANWGTGSGFSALRGGMYSDLGPLDPCPAPGAPVALASVALAAHLTGARSPRQLPAVSQRPGTPIGL